MNIGAKMMARNFRRCGSFTRKCTAHHTAVQKASLKVLKKEPPYISVPNATRWDGLFENIHKMQDI